MVESENFYRFSSILLDLGAKVLREKFMDKHVGSSTFQNYLKLQQPNLSTLLKRNILRKEQFDILYPSNGTPSIDNLDITLLCLMFRNLDTNTQPSDHVWTSPSSTDLSYQADVTRIRIVRNTMYGHLKSASMDAKTYTDEINALKPIFYRLVSQGKHNMTTTQLDDLIRIVLNEPLQIDLGNEIKRLQEEIEKLHEHDVLIELSLNCSLLLLLMDLGTLTLQWYFEKQCAASCSLQQFLNSKKTKLEELCIQNIINEKEKNLLLSSFLLEKLDISLTARLLIHLCEITRPMCDWTEPPETGDKSPGADILRIWNFKDYLYNRPISVIPRAKFLEHWSSICEALSRLSDQLDEQKRIQIKKKIEGVKEAGWGCNAQLCMYNCKEVCGHLQTLPGSTNSNGGSDAAVTEMPKGKEGKICIIKCYADLKLELERDTVIDIAKGLFKKEKHKDVLEEIAKAERRRLCVDKLLKRVLQEETTALHIFFDLLKTKCPERARKLAEIKVTDKDKTNFTQVSKSSKMVLHRRQNGLKFEQVFFQCNLQDAPEKVDKIADLLLSKFLISICDHSQIIHCNDPVRKMHTLLEKLQSCQFDSETEVQNVLGSKLYKKWKHLKDDGSRQGLENQGIWHYFQEKIQQFKGYLIEHFRGYRIYFVEANRGSLVLKFVTMDKFDVKLLQPEAVKTKVWDMIKTVCPEYRDIFKEPVHLTIFFKPLTNTDSAEIHFHLETSSENKIKEECSCRKLGSHDTRYIVEEMNPESLKKWMFNKLQLDEDTKIKLVDLVSWKVMSRRKKMKILLSIVETLGNGYEMLEKYCEEHDTFLYDKVFKKPRQNIVEENPEGAQQNTFSYEKGEGLQMLSSTWIDFTVDPKGEEEDMLHSVEKEKDEAEGVNDSLIDEEQVNQLKKEDAGIQHAQSSKEEKTDKRMKKDRALDGNMSGSMSRCSFCGKKGSVQICNECHQVAYCSKRCRKKGWAKGHRDSCKSGRQLKQSTSSVSEGYSIPKGHPAAESRAFRVTELPFDLSKLDINYVHAPSGEDESAVDSDEKTGTMEAPVSEDSFGNVEAPVPEDSFQNVEAPVSEDSFGNVEAPISEDPIGNEEAPISGDSVGNAETSRSMESEGNKQFLENSNTTNFNNEKKQAENEGKKEICFVCSSKHSVKLCGRCKGIPYCSKECQKSDWRRHKQECNKAEGNTETKEKRKQRAQSRNSKADAIGPGTGVFNPFEFFPFGFAGLYPGMPMDAAQKATPNTPFNVVNTMVRGMYPLKQIIDDFNNLPGEYFGQRPPPSNRILLAFITAFYPHIMRHGIVIRDKKGEETHVLFYLDNDNPLPFFSWNDIRPGLYICFEEAFFHAFMDGTVGLRIEDASTVTILRV